jgi:hypothetical protein
MTGALEGSGRLLNDRLGSDRHTTARCFSLNPSVRHLARIAQATALSDNALSLLLPIFHQVLKMRAPEIRARSSRRV